MLPVLLVFYLILLVIETGALFLGDWSIALVVRALAYLLIGGHHVLRAHLSHSNSHQASGAILRIRLALVALPLLDVFLSTFLILLLKGRRWERDLYLTGLLLISIALLGREAFLFWKSRDSPFLSATSDKREEYDDDQQYTRSAVGGFTSARD